MLGSFSNGDGSVNVTIYLIKDSLFSNLVAIIPTGVKCQMYVNFPGTEFLWDRHQVYERENENFAVLRLRPP